MAITHNDAIDDGNGNIILVVGTSGDDAIDTSGGTLDYTINGDAGNDTITTGDGDTGTVEGGVTVNAGDGDDNITGGAGDDNLRGEGDADTINGGAGADTIDGGAGNDILNGDAGIDLIDGGLGDDTIDGGADDDVIIGSGGTDTVTDTGGSGADKFQYNADIEILQSITETSSGVFDIVTDLGTTTTTGIEFLWFNTTPFINIDLTNSNNRYGTAGGDTITGAASAGSTILAGAGADTIDAGNGDNSVYAGSGDDGITIGTGNDIVDGGSGTDTVNFGYATTAVTNYTNDGTTITLTTSEGVDTFRNVESFAFTDSTVALANMGTTFSSLPGADVNGSSGDDANLDGTASGENINGLAGNDTITPGAGDDVVDGGDDTDTVVFGINTSDVTSYTNNGTTVTIVSAAEGTDTITNVESFNFNGTTVALGALDTTFAAVNTANQTVGGTGAGDTLVGGLGDDTITPGAGDDSVDGNAGTDTVVFGINTSDVTSYTNNGTTVTIVSAAEGTDSITEVESFNFNGTTVALGALDATFAAVNTASQTVGGTGAGDTLVGGLGDDTITPGAGDDSVDGNAGTDTVVFSINISDVTSFTDNGSNSYTFVSSEGTDTIDNVEIFQFGDGIVGAGNLATQFASVATTNQTFTSTSGDDTFVGGAGTDKTVFGFAAADLSALSIAGGVLTVVGTEGTDTLTNIENLQFTDQTVAVSDLALGTTAAESVAGTANADIIAAGAGVDTINAGAGDDLIIGVEAGETVRGSDGTDTVKFSFASSDVTSAVVDFNGSVEVTTAQGTATLFDVENVAFTDAASASIDTIITSTKTVKPTFTAVNNGADSETVTPTDYSGPVDYLEFELLGDNNSNSVTASSENDFLNLLGGDDAANGGDGDDVLDGGLGSNFLTGGNGNDVFFLDGRNASTSTTWSTVTDFTSGDSINIWGWVDGTSNLLLTQASNGASGFEGATFHYDLDGDNQIDTSLTLTGLTIAQVPTPTSAVVGSDGVLIFTA